MVHVEGRVGVLYQFAKVFLVAVILLLPAAAFAQNSGISGQVTDNTGGVLPGVTVEVTSPVLIEGARVAVTDGQGQYSVTALRPGTYTVTATLPGFTTSVREGITLTAGFNANVDIQLGVGAIEESVTVSGASPVVDVQSAQRAQVMTRELLENVPTGRSLWAYGQTVPGVAMNAADVGGSRGTQYVGMASHGSFHSDNAHKVDGLSIKSLDADGQWTAYHNTMMFEEVSYETTGSGADTSGAGVGVNLIPKEGGNTLSGQMFASYVPGSWGSDNLTPELQARGLQASGLVNRIFDYNPSLGGPILRDKLWFFGTYRYWGSDVEHPNSFHNLDPTFRTYQPNFAVQAVDENLLKSGMARLTLQMAQQHKFSAYLDRTSKFRGGECGPLDLYESCGVRYPRIYYTASTKYTGTLSSRLLVEGGLAMSHWTWSNQERQPFISDLEISRIDRTLGTEWSAPDSSHSFRKGPRNVLGGSVSYVTGTHAFKAGVSWDFGLSERWQAMGRPGVIDLTQEYRLGVPVSVVVYNTPIYIANRLNKDLAFYVQDAWTLNRLTVSPGLRVEWLNADIQPMVSGAGRFVPAVSSRPKTACRAGVRTCRRGSRWPTTCSATRGQPSRAASASTCARWPWALPRRTTRCGSRRTGGRGAMSTGTTSPRTARSDR
jgi:hypothetical protein